MSIKFDMIHHRDVSTNCQSTMNVFHKYQRRLKTANIAQRYEIKTDICYIKQNSLKSTQKLV